MHMEMAIYCLTYRSRFSFSDSIGLFCKALVTAHVAETRVSAAGLLFTRTPMIVATVMPPVPATAFVTISGILTVRAACASCGDLGPCARHHCHVTPKSAAGRRLN